MKNSLRLRTLLLASTLATGAAHAADPQPAPAMPDLGKLMTMLNQLVAESDSAAAEEEPAPAAREPAAPPPAPVPPPPAARLATPQLRSTSLTVSGPLGGRGPAPGVTMTESIWRALFPLK